MASLSNTSGKYIVFSYHKNHQQFALKVYSYLKNENIPVWIDIEDSIDKNIYQRYLNRNITEERIFLY